MAIKIQIIGSSLVVVDLVTSDVLCDIPKNTVYYSIKALKEEGLIIFYPVKDISRNDLPPTILLSDAVNSKGIAFSETSFIKFANDNLGTLDVHIQDSTAPIMIVYATKLITETTLSATAVKSAYTISVASAANFVVGQYLTIYSVEANRVFFSFILGINSLVITLDRQIDFEYSIGSTVSVGVRNMNVNGSITPQIYGIRNTTVDDVPLAFDITRIIVHCETVGVNDLSKFGDIIGGLQRGLFFRKVSVNEYRNLFSAKTNGDLKNLMWDFEIQEVQGAQQDGFTGRLIFGGSSELGAVIRLESSQDLQVVIQDNLTTLTRLFVIAEGSEVTM